MKIQFFDQLITGFNFRDNFDIEFLQNLQDLEEAINKKPQEHAQNADQSNMSSLMFAIQSLSENTTSDKSQRNEVLKTLKDDYISHQKFQPKVQPKTTYDVENIGIRQHSLKTKADFIQYELKKHNMVERRPMTVSPPRDRPRSSLRRSCCLVINLSGSKSMQLSGSKRNSYNHQDLAERRTRSVSKRMDESLNETRQQITNIIIHKEAAPRPRLAPIPTAFASTANTTVLLANDHRPTRTRNIPKSAQQSQTMVITQQKSTMQSRHTPYLSQLEQKYTLTKGKAQVSGKKRTSQTRRKVSVLMENSYENKENAKRQLTANNLSQYLTSPSQILHESKDSQEKSHNQTSTVIQDLSLSIKNMGQNTSLLTNSFRSTVTTLTTKKQTGYQLGGNLPVSQACHPTRQLQRVIANSLSARKKRQQLRLSSGSPSSDRKHRFLANDDLPACLLTPQQPLREPQPIKQSSSPLCRQSIQAILALVETSSQVESRTLALQCEELLLQQLS